MVVPDLNPTYDIEWPLWGVQLEPGRGLENAFLIDDLLVYQPTWQEWTEMESYDVIYENVGATLTRAQINPTSVKQLPPVCVLGQGYLDDNELPDWEAQTRRSRSLISALRLYNSGEFIDPIETCIYLGYPDGVRQRIVQVLRSAFYNHPFLDAYVIRDRDVPNITLWAESIARLQGQVAHLNAQLALDSFMLSFRYGMQESEVALHCVMALEALLGRIQAASIDQTVMMLSAVADVDNEDHAGWLAALPGLRNAVAHDLRHTAPTSRDIEFLRDDLRLLLGFYLEHASDFVSEAPIREFQRSLRERADR